MTSSDGLAGDQGYQMNRNPRRWVMIWLVLGLIGGVILSVVSDLIFGEIIQSRPVVYTFDFTVGNLIGYTFLAYLVGKYGHSDIRRAINEL